MPDFVLTGVQARCPCVYVWKRHDTVLYVGVSRYGMARALIRHDYLSEMLPTDALDVYLMPGADSVALHKRKRAMIDALDPTLNRKRQPGRGESYAVKPGWPADAWHVLQPDYDERVDKADPGGSPSGAVGQD